MEAHPLASNCQLAALRLTSEGIAPSPPASLLRRLKLAVRRHLTPSTERKLKRTTNGLANRAYALTNRPERTMQAAASSAADRCEAGDLVRVRSAGEIDATLDHWRQLRGCTFMPEMRQYCGTTQAPDGAVRSVDLREEARHRAARRRASQERPIWCDRSCFSGARNGWRRS